MSNRTILSVTAAAAAFFGISACTTLPVTTDYNPTVGIGVCRTYAFATEHYRSAGDPAAFSNPLNGDRLRAAIEANLNARGLRPAAEHTPADCMVGFAIGTRVVADDFGPYGYGFGYGWRRGWGGWGYGDWPPVRNEGRISVDLFEVKSRTPIWHASVSQDVVDLTGSDAQARINAAAAAIFTKFPIALPMAAPAGARATT
ncbi:MAG: DUF4136 domain-containing protein [Steroidobacteraceae bacterium]|jgi:hypothetical protein